jgi:hypothetical protein
MSIGPTIADFVRSVLEPIEPPGSWRRQPALKGQLDELIADLL